MSVVPTLLTEPASPPPDFSASGRSSTPAVHLLPFHLSYSGPAKVHSYFEVRPSKRESWSSSTTNNMLDGLQDGGEGKVKSDAEADGEEANLSTFEAYFRGRLLLGSKVELPRGYRGQVWRSNERSVVLQQPNQNDARLPRSSNGTKRGISAVDGVTDAAEYSQDSPRRSPRKHATASSSQQAKPQAKAKAKKSKRMKFSLSPDLSPVKDGDHRSPSILLEPAELDIARDHPDEGDHPPKLEEADRDQVVGAVSEERISETTGDQVQQPPGLDADATIEMSDGAGPSTSTPTKRSSEAVAISPTTPKSARTMGTPLTRTLEQAEDEEDTLEDSIQAQKLLQPISQFDSFVVWHPDTECDAGDDVYIRSLAEWTKLASIVSGSARSSHVSRPAE